MGELPKDHGTRELLGSRPEDPIERQRALAEVKAALFQQESRPPTLGRYVILERIGAGGGGVVHLAYDPDLNRRVALKLVRPGSAAPEDGERLLREAQAMARLSHPNVANVYDVGSFDPDQLPEGLQTFGSGGVFLVMEYVEGQELGAWLGAAQRSVREIVRVMLEAGRGLAAAHEKGLVHRDFKPSNVLVGEDGRARVLDFGIARAVDADVVVDTTPSVTPRDTTPALATPLTGAGTVMGTPSYMSPEQHDAAEADARSDQYAFCVVLFEALHGTKPFRAKTLAALAEAKRKGVQAAPTPRRIPPRLSRLILRGLDPDPQRRFPDMQALLRELERDPARRARNVALAGVAVAFVGGTGAWTVQQRAAQEQACQDHSTAIDPVWGEQTKAEVHTAFTRLQSPLAEDSWNSVARGLDAYVAQWTTLRTENCRAATIEHSRSVAEASHVTTCLDRRLRGAEGLVRSMRRIDATTMRGAVRAVAALPRLELCAPPTAGSGESPAADGARSEELLTIEGLLAESASLIAMSDYEGAERVASEASKAAEELGDPGTLSTALRLMGSSLAWQQRLDEALEVLRRARLEAERAGDDAKVIEALLELVEVLGPRLDRVAEANRLAALASARLAAADSYVPPDVELLLDTTVGRLREHQADYEAASAAFERARERARDLYGEDSLRVADMWNFIGVVQERRGHFAEALESFRQVYARRKALLGERHPRTAIARANVAIEMRWIGEITHALSELDAAIATLETSLGPTAQLVAWFRDARGYVLSDMARHDDALEEHTRVYEIRLEALGADHLDTAGSLENLALAHLAAGRHAEGLDHARRAIEAWRDRPDHPGLATARMALGLALTAVGDTERAAAVLAEALEENRRVFGADSVRMHHPLQSIGEAYVDLGDFERAIPLLERSLALGKQAGFDGFYLAGPRFALARALRGADQARAASLARLALADRRRFDFAAKDAEEIERWLAELGRPAEGAP